MKDLFDLDFSRWEIILLSLIPALINIGIFFYVTFFLPQDRTNYNFSVFVILLGLYQIGDGFVRMCSTSMAAVEWYRISEIILLFMIPTGILFTLSISKENKTRKAELYSSYYFYRQSLVLY